MKAGDLVLAGVDVAAVADNPELWEKVVRKLRDGLMPPAGSPRPDEATYQRLLSKLQDDLDAAAARRPDPGRTEVAHRLNRIEYSNAVRDLLGVEINVADLLPADDSSYGFDNIAGVLKMSPALMERYLAAARVDQPLRGRQSAGGASASIYRVSPETQQHDRDDGFRSARAAARSSATCSRSTPSTTSRSISAAAAARQSAPARDHDRRRAGECGPRRREEPAVRVPVTAGPHDVAVTFFRVPPDLVEQVREPFQNPDAPSGTGGIAGRLPSISTVTIAGPYDASGPGDTPSRRRIFTCTPAKCRAGSRAARRRF